MAGFIYILSNPSFVAGRIKIGKSDRDPSEHRLAELNTTGVPEPFHLEYYAFVENHHAVERVLHQQFDSARPNRNREFFDTPTVNVIEAIRKCGPLLFERNFHQTPEEIESARKEAVAQHIFNQLAAGRRQRAAQIVEDLKSEASNLINAEASRLFKRTPTHFFSQRGQRQYEAAYSALIAPLAAHVDSRISQLRQRCEHPDVSEFDMKWEADCLRREVNGALAEVAKSAPDYFR